MIDSSLADQISGAAKAIREGRLVGFPTETVYGLGANAMNPVAVSEIFRVKGRPSDHPVIVHVFDADQLSQVVSPTINDRVSADLQKLMQLWPGPISIVLPKHPDLPGVVTGGRDTVAVRMPSHPVAREFLSACGTPIAAPSANRFGYVSPTCAEHVSAQLGDELEYILDGGTCEVGLESTIVSLLNHPAEILRPGYVTIEEISKLLPHVQYRKARIESPDIRVPGALPSHYSPRTPLRFLCELSTVPNPERTGFISFGKRKSPPFDFHTKTCLSENEDLDVVARNLFASLRKLDDLGLELIVVDSCLEQGVGVAIMDRLRKATYSET